MNLNNKITSSVAGATVVLTLLGILSKGIGFIREITYANNFGLSREFDLFLTSTAFIIVLNTAVIYLCQHYFIPAYNRCKSISEKESELFFRYTFWWFLIGGILIAGILYLISNFFLNFYLSSLPAELKEKGLDIFLLFLITIPFNSGASVIFAYFQANFNFVFPAISQIVLNVTVILLIIFFTEMLEIFVLPVSFCIAYFFAFILVWIPVRQKLNFLPKGIFRYKYKISDVNVFLSLIFIESLSLSYILIDRYFLGKVPEGGIAALNYAFVIYLLPVSVFSLPLITTIFSKFSKSFKDSSENLKNDFINAIRVNAFIIIPLSFLIFFKGDFLLYIFYERGEFSSGDTILTYTALQYYSIGLIFYSTYLIAVKLMYSINKYHLILIISIIAFLLKIIFNFLFVDYLMQDGLALSTSLIYIYLFFSGIHLAKNLTQKKNKLEYLLPFLYYITNSLVAYTVSYFIVDIFFEKKIIVGIVQIFMFFFIYSSNSFLVKDKGSEIIKYTLKKLLCQKEKN